MSPDEEYIGLTKTAQDALYAVLKQTEPGTGMTLHHAYGDLKRTVDRYDEAQRERERTDRNDQYWQRRQGWKATTRGERERVALELLGEDRLILRELTERFQAKMPDCQIHEPDIRRVVNRLFKTRELDRKAEPRVPGGKAIRYRYFRRELAGPIADLERVFHEQQPDEEEF